MKFPTLEFTIPCVEKKKSNREGLTNFILPGGEVFSCQPNGKPDVRESGTDGAYEQGQDNGNYAGFLVEGNYFIFGVVMVDKL